MNVSAEIEEIIRFEIKNAMYYVEYPDDVQNGLWKNGKGDLLYINEMGLDHLKSSIMMIKRDIKRLGGAGRPAEVTNILIPKAQHVLAQLEAAFNRKKRL